ncbi:hypothetical protein ACXX81_15660 [Pseudomonas sp. GNP013]
MASRGAPDNKDASISGLFWLVGRVGQWLAYVLDFFGLGFLLGLTLIFSLMLSLVPARYLPVNRLVLVQG